MLRLRVLGSTRGMHVRPRTVLRAEGLLAPPCSGFPLGWPSRDLIDPDGLSRAREGTLQVSVAGNAGKA